MALTDIKVRAAKPADKQYKLTDGGDMHSFVHPNGSKYWHLQYRYEGKQKMLALGAYPEITLADVRVCRDEAHKLLANGVGPGDKKKNDKVEQSKVRTFKEVAIEWHSTGRKWPEDYAHRVLKSLGDNLFAALGERNIAELETRNLLTPTKAVEISEHLEVVVRLQQRTTVVMRYVVQSGLIDYSSAQEMVGAVASCNRQHRPALESKRILRLLIKIDSCTGRPLTRWATELSLLISIRSSELHFARWSEIDFEASIRTIPPERELILEVKHSHRGSKMRTTRLVSLSTQAFAILKQVKQFCGAHDLIFTGDHDSYKLMSENTVNSALWVTGYGAKVEVCGHGFRTMACSSLVESGLWSRDVVGRQTSHMERNPVRAAYTHKVEHLEERRLMLQWWADFPDASREKFISPSEYVEINNPLKQ